jgi:type IX secretion system PorP/SprF family membrane protein
MASAQQEPQYTQYMFNPMSVNPAYTGTRDALSATFLTRHQWAGMDGAPRTYDFSVHTPLNNYNMGVGFSVVSDNYGPVKNLFFNVNYAYRVRLSQNTILSMGIKGSLYNYHVNLSGLDTDVADPAFDKDLEQKFSPGFGAGIYLYSDKFYAGISVPRLLETDLNGNQSTTGKIAELKRHYYFMTGIVLGNKDSFRFRPSLITRAVEGAPFSAEITGQFIFNQMIWAGVSYRTNKAVAMLAGVRVSPQLMVGYAFDFPVAQLKPFDSGTHEVVISYDFKGFMREKLVSPRYF